MTRPLIGLNLGDLRLGAKEAIALAAQLAVNVLEIPAVAGELSPRELSESGRRHVVRYVSGLGMSLASLSADMPQARLTDPAAVDARIERTREIIELAAALKVRLVTTSVGALTHPDTGEPSPVALEALRAMGERADLCGCVLAIRPSHDTPERIERVLAALDCPALRIGIDPAAAAMVGVNPLPLVERFAGRIALVHARDATAGGPRGGGHETRFGEGEVDLETFYAMLSAVDYAGPHILRRTDSQTAAQDIAAGRDALIRMMR